MRDWCRRSEGSAAVLRMMQTAVAEAQSGAGRGDLPCKVPYRLARYADKLYRGTIAHKRSPDYVTAQAVIRHKRQQVIAISL